MSVIPTTAIRNNVIIKSVVVLLLFVQRHWVIISLGLLTLITALSLFPAEQLPKVPGTDKTHHFIAYATLMLPTALRRPRYGWAIGLGFIAYSGLIELLQPLVNRRGEWLDLFANAGGVAIGAVIGWGVCAYLRRYE